MEKPQPKELVVETFGSRIVRLHTNSEDAVNWVEQEGKDFGSLWKEQGFYNLIVSPAYDLSEVVKYLDSYNKS